VTNKTALKPYPVDIYKITDHLAALIERYGAVANAVRAGIARRTMPAMPIQQIF
jgi:starvation-inducible DNA-binding protein